MVSLTITQLMKSLCIKLQQENLNFDRYPQKFTKSQENRPKYTQINEFLRKITLDFFQVKISKIALIKIDHFCPCGTLFGHNFLNRFLAIQLSDIRGSFANLF